ncbi:hypothetical protein AAC387_Pa09g0955 [Persea americana]
MEEEIARSVMEEMNELLFQEFTTEKMTTALAQLHPTNAPSSDDIPPLFFQKYWHLEGKNVFDAVLSVLDSDFIHNEINHTCIVLILENKPPEKTTDVRPLSLCNVVYKLISKVIANRLKKVLAHIISENQSSFVPARQITDNTLVAYEAVNSLKQKQRGEKGIMSIELDMSKAYDMVEWGFLEKVTLRLGFQRRCVSLIMECITSVYDQYCTKRFDHPF